MLRRLLLPFALTVVFAAADFSAQAQQRKRPAPARRTHAKPRSSDDVKLAPGMRLGRPLPLTTDYMGRPLKPKPAKPAPGSGATSMSAKTAPAASAAAAPAKAQTSKLAAPRKRR